LPVAADAEITGAELETAWRSVVGGVSRAQRCIDQAVEEAGVPRAWFPVLLELLLIRGHRAPMSTLASEVAMSPGGFTKLADRMAREGLIDRRGSVSDRRVIHVALTEDGLVMARRARRAYQQALRLCVLPPLSAEDLAASARAFDRILPAEAGVDAPTPKPALAPRRGDRPAGERRRGGRTG
jgi:DNA-binding MarR family transcriptional regulator